MDIKRISPDFAVSEQITPADVAELARQGFCTIICNRPDGESDDQPAADAVARAAEEAGIAFRYLPVKGGEIGPEQIAAFGKLLADNKAPILAYCRTGTRSITLWSLVNAPRLRPEVLLATAENAGYDLSRLAEEFAALHENRPFNLSAEHHDIVIIGGGAAGLATAGSLLRRNPDLDIAVVEPRDEHYYQPGWTLVGAGVFTRNQTRKPMAAVMPKGVKWIRLAAAAFLPEQDEVILENGEVLSYKQLVVAPGIKLDWDRIEGLRETLGRNGVTSNYTWDTAPYTWELVKGLGRGRAIFTQPPMPIKCAGAPQKVMYLSADYWHRKGRLKDIEIEFYNTGAVLFGVQEYVPALEEYVRKYDARLHFGHTLVKVDGENRVATFEVTDENGPRTVERTFDMLHVSPPQTAPDFIRISPLANEAGWVDVDQFTLRHTRYPNVWSLGDASSAPNAKTAAAVRKQAPVVAENIVAVMAGGEPVVGYNGYGSCPLTVERGRIVLAEFAYGGRLDPSFPSFILDGRKPTRLAWFMKEKLLPPMYWYLMFRGHEWLAEPQPLNELVPAVAE